MGGFLFSDKATGIKQSDVAEAQGIAKTLLLSLGIPEENIDFTGSAGKKHPDVLSGDIDCVFIKPDGFVFEDFRDSMKARGYDVRWSKRFNIISTVLSYSAGVVQVDFLPIEDMTYAKWGMWSDDYTKTQYKSALRNDIIRAALEVKTKKILETNEDGEAVVWTQETMIPSRGLFVQRWSRASKRKNYLLKYPNMIEETFITSSVEELMERAFGVKTPCFNAEEAIEMLKNDPQREEIFKIARGAAIYEEYPYPKEWDYPK